MTALARYEAARMALADAHRVDEAKEIRDKAGAMAMYARQAKDSELIMWASEIKVRAERRLGELIRRQKETVGLNSGAKGSVVTGSDRVPVKDSRPTLADAGIDKKLSSRAQKLASMPEDVFEMAVETARETDGHVTTTHMLRVAKKLHQKDEPEPQPTPETKPEPTMKKPARVATDPDKSRLYEEGSCLSAWVLASRAKTAIQQISKEDPNAIAAIDSIRAALEKQISTINA